MSSDDAIGRGDVTGLGHRRPKTGIGSAHAHDWVRELMAERLGAATLRAHHGMLARMLTTWPAPA